MTGPIPVRFNPIFKPKPWGGRHLAELFEKPLPGTEPIGESWELVSLPGNESHVRGGPLDGTPITELVEKWGRDLLGHAELADGRFPLLIKLLDARENLSVQVHPKPRTTGWEPGIKHEAWYVLHAEPGAKMYIGLKPGVGPDDLRQAANTPAMADLLQQRPAGPGDCFYLPSGVMHALGEGLVVAEIQTPSDVTYRIYDWERVDDQGRPRELHIEQSLENTRFDVGEEEIVQPRQQGSPVYSDATRVTVCDAFAIDAVSLAAGFQASFPRDEMTIWIILNGQGELWTDGNDLPFARGDTILIPANHRGTEIRAAQATHLLEATVPAR